MLILKEACDIRFVNVDQDSAKLAMQMHLGQASDLPIACGSIPEGKKLCFTWRIDNFISFKEILETRKIFSKYFTIGGCELRIGVCASPVVSLRALLLSINSRVFILYIVLEHLRAFWLKCLIVCIARLNTQTIVRVCTLSWDSFKHLIILAQRLVVIVLMIEMRQCFVLCWRGVVTLLQ